MSQPNQQQQQQNQNARTAEAVGQLAGSLLGAGLRLAASGISTARAVVAQPTRSGGPYATTAAPAAAPMAAPYSATAYPTSAPTAAVPPPYTPSTSASAYQATAAPVQGGYRTESYGAAMSDEALARKMQMEENANGGGPYASNQAE
eukprot:gene23030-6332_t